MEEQSYWIAAASAYLIPIFKIIELQWEEQLDF